jgi:hypothetical protein
MADITIYNNTNLTVEVINGPPPADQTAVITQLQADKTALQAEIATAKTDAQKVVTDLT